MKRLNKVNAVQYFGGDRGLSLDTFSDFSTGTYFLTISSANQTKTEKIIINK
jgi:hypothetical protein